MTVRAKFLPLGFGLSALLCTSPRGEAHEQRGGGRPPARVYTNEDLERVHPLRHETGVSSVPAVAPSEAATAPEPTGRSRRRGEEYWRREARRVRDRVRTLAGQAATLRAQLAEREEERRRFAYRRRGSSASGSDATLRARLETTEHRMRELEDELQERARREGALPGWLR